MRVADYIFKFLAERGARHAFLVTGGGAMFLNNGLLHEKRITPICCHNEQGAAIAAEGYARVTGELSIVSVTTGPGGTNALTGVIGEWLDSQPVLYISGQVKLSTSLYSEQGNPLRQLGDQEINIVDIVRPVTKYAVMLTEPVQVRYELEKAVYLAEHGRKGPVWIDVPINIQSAEIEPERLQKFVPAKEYGSSEIDDDIFEYIVASLVKAKSPVIIAGQGIRLAGAQDIFLEMADCLGIPVLATFEGFDLMPSGDEKMVGRIGTIGTRAGNIALQNADWILCIGSRNNIRQVSYNYENFASNAKNFICVDIDQAELDKHTIKPTMKVHCDAKVFIMGMRCHLPANYQRPQTHVDWLNWCRVRKDRYPVVLDEYKHVENGINPYVFAEMLTSALSEDAIVMCTNATPSLALFQAGIVKAGQRMVCNSGCAAMGYGMPASLGAACAASGTGRDVVCLEGDGSLMMNVQELQTIASNRLPVKLFLFDNNEYCSIRQTHDNFFHERIGCDAYSGVTFPNWELVAAAFGWKYTVIDSIAAAEKLIPEILAENVPVFCDVKLVPDYVFAPKLSARRLEDGTLVSPSLEDMAPFLSREEMRDNVYRK